MNTPCLVDGYGNAVHESESDQMRLVHSACFTETAIFRLKI